MKNSKTLNAIFAILILAVGIISCNKPADSFKVGDAVAAKWTDGNYWTAKIKSITGDKYEVAYDDGTSGTVTKSELKPLAAKDDLKVGDAVWGVWSGNARMYQGKITELQSGGALVKWDDGSTPSLVPYDKIAK